MQNLYNITSNTAKATDSPTFLPPGIHEDIKMSAVEHTELPDGKGEFIVFTFEDAKGNTAKLTEWPKTADKPLEAMSEEERKTFEGRVEGQMSMFRQIIEVFKPIDETLQITATSFKGLAEEIIKFLGDSYKDKLVRLKVTYDNKDWANVPKTYWNTVIEPMAVSKEDSKITILPNDKMERTNARKDIEQKENNPLEDTPKGEDKGDNSLPF